MIETIMRISPTMEPNQVYNEMDSPPPDSNNHEDQRALQIALELSNLGLLGPGDDDSSTSSYDEITKSKKSQNMTECVPVPSSEHVAEIVGRQGCKIKALRAKTNTYIKTPVRGEEPVFVVTGRKEDVALARREIQSAAEHFTQIRATRNKGVATATAQGNTAVLGNMTHLPGAPTAAELSAPGMITLQVRVPYRVVGLVVGPKGATIKRIQQQTHTYIVTPSREKEPVFEVTGLPENVEKAKEDIEAHIATRTGCQQLNIEEDFANNGILVGSPAAQQLAKQQQQNLSFLSQPFYNKTQQPQNLQSSAFSPYNNVIIQNQRQNSFETRDFGYLEKNYRQAGINHFVNPNGLGLNEIESRLDTITRKYSNESVNPTWSPNFDYQSDSCFSPLMQAPSYSMESHSIRSSSNSSTSPPLSNILTNRLSPTLSDPDYITAPAMIPPCSASSITMSLSMRPSQDSITDSIPEFGTKTVPIGINTESGYSSGGTTDSQTSGSIDSMTSAGSTTLPKLRRTCISCNEGAVNSALVPCGHNLFCYNCAQRAVETSSSCPSCSQTATMALLIKT